MRMPGKGTDMNREERRIVCIGMGFLMEEIADN